MYKDLEKKYEQAVKDMMQHISSSKNASPRKNWTDREKEKWSLREPHCKICKLPFSNINIITKEHIHPLVLGGYETDENIIPLCKKCNDARNQVMTQILGTTSIGSIRKNYPANRLSLIQFILWCHVTIYSNSTEIALFPHLNEAFHKSRGVQISSQSSGGESSPKMKKPLKNRIWSKIKNQLKRETEQSNHNLKNSMFTPCQQCGQSLRLSIENVDKKFRCPRCKFEQKIEREHEAIDKVSIDVDSINSNFSGIDNDELKNDFIQYLIDLIKSKNTIKLEALNQQIGDFLIKYKLKKPSELKKLLGFKPSYHLWKMLPELAPNEFQTFKDEEDKWVVSLIEGTHNHTRQKITEELDPVFEIVEKQNDKEINDVATIKQEIYKELTKQLHESEFLQLESVFNVHLKDLLSNHGFDTPTKLKLYLGYGKNTSLKKILSEIGNGIFTFEKITEKKWILRLSI